MRFCVSDCRVRMSDMTKDTRSDQTSSVCSDDCTAKGFFIVVKHLLVVICVIVTQRDDEREYGMCPSDFPLAAHVVF